MYSVMNASAGICKVVQSLSLDGGGNFYSVYTRTVAEGGFGDTRKAAKNKDMLKISMLSHIFNTHC